MSENAGISRTIVLNGCRCLSDSEHSGLARRIQRQSPHRKHLESTCMRAQQNFVAVAREISRRRSGNCNYSSKPQKLRTRQNETKQRGKASWSNRHNRHSPDHDGWQLWPEIDPPLPLRHRNGSSANRAVEPFQDAAFSCLDRLTSATPTNMRLSFLERTGACAGSGAGLRRAPGIFPIPVRSCSRGSAPIRWRRMRPS